MTKELDPRLRLEERVLRALASGFKYDCSQVVNLVSRVWFSNVWMRLLRIGYMDVIY